MAGHNRLGNRISLLVAVVALASMLGGCFTPFIEGATELHDVDKRLNLTPEAEGGNAKAQFEVGNGYCCHAGGPLDSVSVYDNAKATEWYCKAAHQGYAPAQLRLAQIYAGDPIKGLDITQHASAALGDPPSNRSVALMWATLAAQSGAGDAAQLRDQLAKQASPAERRAASDLIKHWVDAPCLWNEVFGSTTAG